MVIQQERQHLSSGLIIGEPNTLINVVDRQRRPPLGRGRGGTPRSGGRISSSKLCTFCGRTGHTVDVCYGKHGYPPGHPWYPGKPRVSRPQTSNSASINHATIKPDHENVTVQGPKNITDGSGLGITPTQYQSLMALLQNMSGSTFSGSVDNPQPNQVNMTYSTQNGPHTSSGPSPGNIHQHAFTSHLVNHSSIDTHSQKSHSSSWIIDSGVTDHVASSLHWFKTHSKIDPVVIHLPNGTTVTAHLHNVLYVSFFHFNLIFISKLVSTLCYSLTFVFDSCKIQEVNSLRVIGLAKLRKGLYYLADSKMSTHLQPNNVVINHTAATPITTSNLWHFRLRHLSGNRLNILCQTYPFISRHVDEICDVCHLAKQRRLSYLPSLNKASKIFELIHLDIWGPYSKQSVHGHKYFLTILDDFSHYTWTILLKSKAEVQSKVEHFINFAETQFEIKVKSIRSDNGPEFCLKSFLASKDILHQTSCVKTPQ